ncbi:MAG TPA: hypothetical protein VG742_23350, partial [Dongiaceae bacterium]|nr:hypothetical protein [Dongiaceae bacterium]
MAVALMLLASDGAQAQGEVYVIESSVPSISVGTGLAPADRLSVPAGDYVRVVLPSGKTQTIKGPFQGAASDLANGQATNDGVMAWLRTLLETGGSTQRTSGATRSMRRAGGVAPQVAFSWTAIPVTWEGDICVQRGAALALARPSTARPEQVTVVDAASKAQAQTGWAVGQNTVPWPAALPPRPEGIYLLMIPDRARRQVKLHMLDRLPGDD